MNYPKIYTSKELIEILLSQLKKDPANNYVFEYVNNIQLKINDKYTQILKELPDYEKMDDYYKMMFKNITPETTMAKYKNHYEATLKIINQICEKYKQLLKRTTEYRTKLKYKREFLGRLVSMIKKLDSTNEKLLELGKEFRRIARPLKKFTIVLVGYPNTGKTTLLTKLTDADPEINSYAFTTKALNLGYFKLREEIIQVVDTPGLIHTLFKEMNTIEKQAVVAIKTLADVVIFLYNKNEDENLQRELLAKIREENPTKKFFVHPSFGGELTGESNITIEDIHNKNF